MKRALGILGFLALSAQISICQAAPQTSTLDYWSDFTGLTSTKVSSFTGTLYGGSVTIASLSNTADLLQSYTNGYNAWDPSFVPATPAGLSNPGIFAANPIAIGASAAPPAGTPATNPILAISSHAAATNYRFSFSQPIYNPRILMFSVDSSVVGFTGNVKSDNNPATISVTTNSGASWNGATQTLSRVTPAGYVASAPEGCFDVTPRGCASLAFAGTYAALNFSITGADGTAYQVGGQSVIHTEDQGGSSVVGTSGTLFSLLSNDTLNGNPVQATGVNMSLGANTPSGLSMDATGNLVSDGTLQPGTYVFDYTLCDKQLPDNCATSQVTLTITAKTPSSGNPVSVPTLGEWGLILLAAMAGALGLRARRKA